MNRLFIIGNGFDSAHGIKTEYCYFRDYLVDRYRLDLRNQECPEPSGTYQQPDGDMAVDKEAAARLAGWLIIQVLSDNEDAQWNSFERALGELDYEIVMDEAYVLFGEIEDFHDVYRYEDFASDLSASVLEIQKLFSEWVGKIKIVYKPKRRMQSLLTNGAMVLNFNYTETLEAVYGVPDARVCHIHGDRRKQSNLVVGHGKKERRDYSLIPFAAQGNIEAIHEKLRKDTKGNICSHKDFFDSLGKNCDKIKEVYSYGFSFEDVDLPYIEEVCRKLDTSDMVWYQNDYDNAAELKRKESQIRKCGYVGKFDTFSV